jgi:hypothetical protein
MFSDSTRILGNICTYAAGSHWNRYDNLLKSLVVRFLKAELIHFTLEK